MYDRLGALAVERDETISQCARRILAQASESSTRPSTMLDDAITALQLVRNSLDLTANPVDVPATSTLSRTAAPRPAPSDAGPPSTGSIAAEEPRPPAREVNVHNAKSNLSRLIGDVGRGEEIVIVHAGTPRARLVAVDDDGST